MNHSLLPLGAALLALGLGALPTARAQNVKPPKAQLWMDVSTGGMAGMPEMDGNSGMGAMLGGLAKFSEAINSNLSRCRCSSATIAS